MKLRKLIQAIALLTGTVIELAKTAAVNRWDNFALNKITGGYQFDYVGYDLTQLFQGGTVRFQGLVDSSNNQSALAQVVTPFNASRFQTTSLQPQACNTVATAQAFFGDDFWVLCNNNQLKLFALNFSTSQPYLLSSTQLTIDPKLGQAGSYACKAVTASGNGQDVFVLCKTIALTSSEVFEIIWVNSFTDPTSGNKTVKVNSTVVWTAANGQQIGDVYKLQVFGTGISDTNSTGYCVIVTPILDNPGIYKGFYSNIVLKVAPKLSTPAYIDNKTIVNYPYFPPNKGPQGGNVTLIASLTDTQNLYLVVKEVTPNEVVPQLNDIYFYLKRCDIGGPLISSISCTVNLTQKIFLLENQNPGTTFPLLVTAQKGLQHPNDADIVIATPSIVRLAYYGDPSRDGYSPSSNICDIQLMPNQSTGTPVNAFYLNNKIYVWYEGYNPTNTSQLFSFFRVVNPNTCTSVDVSLNVPITNGKYYIRKNFYRPGSVNLVAVGSLSIGSAPIRRPDVRIRYPKTAYAKVTSDIINATYQIAAMPVTQTQEIFISKKIVFTWLRNFFGGLQFGTGNIHAYGYLGAGNHIPTFANQVQGNGLKFVPANNTAFDIRYASQFTCNLTPNMTKVLANGVVTVSGTSENLFVGNLLSGIFFGVYSNAIPGIINASVGVSFTYNVSQNSATQGQQVINIYSSAALRNNRIVIFTAGNNANPRVLTSNIIIFDAKGDILFQKVYTKFWITSAQTYFYEDTCIIMLTWKPMANQSSSIYPEQLKFISIPNITQITTTTAANTNSYPVQAVGLGKICAQSMQGYPYPSTDDGAWRFAIRSKCGNKTYSTVYYLKFAFYNPSGAVLLNTFFLPNLGGDAQMCLSRGMIHAVSVQGSVNNLRIFSYDASLSGGTLYITPLTAYSLSSVLRMYCNPAKGTMHLLALQAQKKLLINFNAGYIRDPRKRIHSVLPINGNSSMLVSLYSTISQTDKIVLLNFYAADSLTNSELTKINCHRMYTSGPHLTLKPGSAKNQTGSSNQTFTVTMDSFGNVNNTQNTTRTFNVSFIKPQLKGNLILADPDIKIDLSLAANNSKVFDLNKYINFTGPIRKLTYIPRTTTSNNVNEVAQRITKTNNSLYNTLKTQLQGAKINGNLTLTWDNGKATLYVANNGALSPQGTINGIVLSAEIIFSAATQQYYVFALMSNDNGNGEKFVAAWYKSASTKNWVALKSGIIANGLVKPQFVSLTDDSGAVAFFMGGVINGAYGTIMFHSLVLQNNLFNVTALQSGFKTFDNLVTQFSAVVIQNTIVVTAFADTDKGTWFAGLQINSLFPGVPNLLMYTSGFFPVIKSTVNDNSGTGHVTDHYNSKLACFGVDNSNNPLKQSALFCAYVTEGVYTYGVRIALNLGTNAGPGIPIVDIGSSSAGYGYFNPPGYIPWSVFNAGDFVLVTFIKDPVYKAKGIPATSQLSEPWLVVAYSGYQNTSDVATLRSPVFSWGPKTLNNPGDVSYLFLTPSVATGPDGGRYVIINSNNNVTTGNPSTIYIYNVNPKWQFEVKQVKQIDVTKDYLGVLDWSGAVNNFPIGNFFKGGAGPGPTPSKSTSGNPVAPGNDAIYIVIIILIVLIASAVIGYILYIKKRDELKFKQEFDDNLQDNLAENDDEDGDDADLAKGGEEDTQDGDTLLTKSEFSRM